MNESLQDTLLVAQTSQGLEIRATPLKVTRHQVTFEFYSAATVLQTSEVLNDFQIIFGGQTVYTGRAVIRNIINAGVAFVCEAALEEGWLEAELLASIDDPAKLNAQFNRFFEDWKKTYQIIPEFKVLIADIHSFLTDLRLWLDQVELAIRSLPSGERLALEQKTINDLSVAMLPAIGRFFGEFERIAEPLPEEVRAAYRAYTRRNLHPLILAAPFVYRTFQKPLGYAGDYEMVNMIVLNPHEGGSLFAKVVNHWFLQQAPAEAHRNRIVRLVEVLKQELARCHANGKRMRVFNLGCGPAVEIQRFIEQNELAGEADITLVDFNEETLQHAQFKIEEVKRKFGRSTSIKFQKKSVQQMLKEAAKSVQRSAEQQYDFVYCAGLFDYLSDPVCQRLLGVLYDLVIPGGLLLATNVDVFNPSRQTMEYVLDWHLIYRNSQQANALRPSQIPADIYRVMADETSVNIFLEARKPANG